MIERATVRTQFQTQGGPWKAQCALGSGAIVTVSSPDKLDAGARVLVEPFGHGWRLATVGQAEIA